MRNLILLGCVLFASACDMVGPENATTVRIVNVATPATRNDPFLLRIQNIGPAGSFQAVGYEEIVDAGYSHSDLNHVRYTAVCSRVPTAIEANTTINTQIAGCGNHTVDYVVIHSTATDGRSSATTACYNVGFWSCPSNFARDR